MAFKSFLDPAQNALQAELVTLHLWIQGQKHKWVKKPSAALWIVLVKCFCDNSAVGAD